MNVLDKGVADLRSFSSESEENLVEKSLSEPLSSQKSTENQS